MIVRTFDTPTKCDTCTSVMFGLVRQGLVCKSKQFNPVKLERVPSRLVYPARLVPGSSEEAMDRVPYTF